MPLLYGEGRKSFIRLQEEIMKSGYDFTLFAWSKGPICDSLLRSNASQTPAHPSDSEFSGLLASSPALFTNSTKVVPLEDDFDDLQGNSVAAGGVIVRLPTFTRNRNTFAALPCLYQGAYICLKLHHWHKRFVAREASLFTTVPNDLYTGEGELRLQKLFFKAPAAGPLRAPVPSPIITYLATVGITPKNVRLVDVQNSSSTHFNRALDCWELPLNQAGLHLAYRLRPESTKLSLLCWDTALLVGGDGSSEDGVWIAAVPILPFEKGKEFYFEDVVSVLSEVNKFSTTMERLQAELASGTNSSVFAKPGQSLVTFVAAIGIVGGQMDKECRENTVFEARLEERSGTTISRVIELRVEEKVVQ